MLYGRRHILLLCLLAATELAAGPGRTHLPNLPQIQLSQFAPAVRERIGRAYTLVRAKPGDAAANGKLGMLLHAYDQHELAALFYQRARTIEPQAFRWAYYLGTAQAALGRHESAAGALREALARQPDYLAARLTLAESLLAAGFLSESQQSIEAVLAKNSGSPVAHYLLGRILAARGHVTAAVEHYRRACDLSERFGAAHYALGLAYRDLAEAAKAEEQFSLYEKDKLSWPATEDPLMDEVKALNESALYYVRRGVGLQAAGQLPAAAAEHERALRIDPTHVQAHINLIVLYGKLGQIEKAEKHYRAAVAINPNQAEAHYNFGVLKVDQGKAEEAASAFGRALEINPFYADAHNNFAYLLMTEGKLAEAERHYHAAIENKPNHRLAHFNLGRILVNQAKTEEAIEHFLQTLEPEDENTPGFLYALGAAYARARDRSKALHYINEARSRAAALGQQDLLKLIERDLRLLEQ